MSSSPTNIDAFNQQIWQEIEALARNAGLDPTKFTDDHRKIVAQIIEFLQATPPDREQTAVETNGLRALSQWADKNAPRLARILGKRQEKEVEDTAVSPIIICGKPGTGKTTFLYVIDTILRQAFNLPDNIKPIMHKQAQQYSVHKRAFNSIPVSLLSVRKWAQLLHFHAWDLTQHRLVREDRNRFIQDILSPMRILFADEVEMTGYAPTIPQLAKQGILVIGTSNQYEFRQLDNEQIPPTIYQFRGLDMRAGNPSDAIVMQDDPFWAQFERLQEEEEQALEQLAYRVLGENGRVAIHLNFQNAVQAPLLETEWIHFLQETYQQLSDRPALQPDSSLTLFFDQFSLDILRNDYNAIIRFVSLFDAIEQLGVGVLVRHSEHTPELSRESITHMKTIIYNAIGVPEEIKQRTVIGLDRCTSRIGQAGHKARL